MTTENTENNAVQETPVIPLNANQEQPVVDPNINPETKQPYTENEKIVKYIAEYCEKNQVSHYTFASAFAQSLVKQTNVVKKAIEEEQAIYNANIGAMKNAELHANMIKFNHEINRETILKHELRIAKKELQAREINAERIIDNHVAEMNHYQKQLTEKVISQISLTATTPEHKELAEKVAELFGYKLTDIANANKAEINKIAGEFAKEQFEAWVLDYEANLKARNKSDFYQQVKEVLGEKALRKLTGK